MEVYFKFDTLQEVKEYYGERNLVPIDYIKQQIFYSKKGIQPKFVCENENENGRNQGIKHSGIESPDRGFRESLS